VTSYPSRINKLPLVTPASSSVCPLVSLSSHVSIGAHVIYFPSITAVTWPRPAG